MTRRFMVALLVCLTLVSCAIPHEREADEGPMTKLAIPEGEVDAVYEQYREIYNAAVEIGDGKPLSVVEGGAVLDIDTAAFGVDGDDEPSTLSAEQAAIPSFDGYPLWFVALASEADEEGRRVQVFARGHSVDSWMLVASPRIVEGVGLPELRVAGEATAVVVPVDDGRGMAASPEEAVEAYAEQLSRLPEAPDGGDDFVQQMADSYQQNATLPDVVFTQEWAADPVEYAVRTADGGALVFATLRRTDRFEATSGSSVTWPAGTVQNALAPEGIAGSGSVRFAHQVLLRIPAGSGQVTAIGQYGGVVGVDQS
ncbi:MAG: hypothetical protein QM621_05000 [Aeromicrobium sp.]|uniref:hypothetical protein n=1 Tax=Aeromicrobium sp. TaxID=1871063 RepID=UPI0039E22512